MSVNVITLILGKFRWHHGMRDVKRREPIQSLDECSQWGDQRLTVSPHSLSNKFSSKSVLMGSRKSHAAFRPVGEAATMVNTTSWFFWKTGSYRRWEGVQRREQREISWMPLKLYPSWKRETLWIQKQKNTVDFIHFLLKLSSIIYRYIKNVSNFEQSLPNHSCRLVRWTRAVGPKMSFLPRTSHWDLRHRVDIKYSD